MSTEDLINHVLNQDFSKASVSFNDLIGSKVNDALDAERIAVAGQIFNGADPDDEEQLEFDLDDVTDEELDDAFDDDDDLEEQE